MISLNMIDHFDFLITQRRQGEGDIQMNLITSQIAILEYPLLL